MAMLQFFLVYQPLHIPFGPWPLKSSLRSSAPQNWFQAFFKEDPQDVDRSLVDQNPSVSRVFHGFSWFSHQFPVFSRSDPMVFEGFWDPLGFTKTDDAASFRRRRYVELKHGRVAMFACLGYIAPGIGWWKVLERSGKQRWNFGRLWDFFFKRRGSQKSRCSQMILWLWINFQNRHAEPGGAGIGDVFPSPEKNQPLSTHQIVLDF